MGGKHGEPWRITEGDSVVKVLDGNEVCIAAVSTQPYWKRFSAEDLANARRICLCVNACTGLSDESLEAGVIEKAREALDIAVVFAAVWSGRYQVEYGLDAAHPKHQEALEQIQAALALIQEAE